MLIEDKRFGISRIIGAEPSIYLCLPVDCPRGILEIDPIKKAAYIDTGRIGKHKFEVN